MYKLAKIIGVVALTVAVVWLLATDSCNNAIPIIIIATIGLIFCNKKSFEKLFK